MLHPIIQGEFSNKAIWSTQRVDGFVRGLNLGKEIILTNRMIKNSGAFLKPHLRCLGSLRGFTIRCSLLRFDSHGSFDGRKWNCVPPSAKRFGCGLNGPPRGSVFFYYDSCCYCCHYVYTTRFLVRVRTFMYIPFFWWGVR